MMARMVRVLAVVVGVLLLAGCVPTKPVPEPGFTDAEREAWYDSYEDLQWSMLGLTDQDRPEIQRREVAPDEFRDEFPACMGEQGFELTPGGSYLATDARVEDLSLVIFVCTTTLAQAPETFGVPGPRQADFAYDYYQDVLIPCMTAAGYGIRSGPDRATFRTNPWWHPYLELEAFRNGPAAVPDALVQRCDPYPKGDIVPIFF